LGSCRHARNAPCAAFARLPQGFWRFGRERAGPQPAIDEEEQPSRGRREAVEQVDELRHAADDPLVARSQRGPRPVGRRRWEQRADGSASSRRMPGRTRTSNSAAKLNTCARGTRASAVTATDLRRLFRAFGAIHHASDPQRAAGPEASTRHEEQPGHERLKHGWSVCVRAHTCAADGLKRCAARCVYPQAHRTRLEGLPLTEARRSWTDGPPRMEARQARRTARRPRLNRCAWLLVSSAPGSNEAAASTAQYLTKCMEVAPVWVGTSQWLESRTTSPAFDLR
jgi:hypothetical protein